MAVVSGTQAFLREIGVAELPARTSPFDPGYDPATVVSHLAQSGGLMSRLKLSMACWLIADEKATQAKIAAAQAAGVRTVTGGGPFEIAAAQGRMASYLDLCADLGIDRIEAGEGFTHLPVGPPEVLREASRRGLEVQFELGDKTGGPFTPEVVEALLIQAREWLDAGAVQVVVEGRESGAGIGMFDHSGRLDLTMADHFADELGMDVVVFEAPTKASQFALLDHFGPGVHLSNVRLEELLRVEIYRRGLHSDAFRNERLRPPPPPEAAR